MSGAGWFEESASTLEDLVADAGLGSDLVLDHRQGTGLVMVQRLAAAQRVRPGGLNRCHTDEPADGRSRRRLWIWMPSMAPLELLCDQCARQRPGFVVRVLRRLDAATMTAAEAAALPGRCCDACGDSSSQSAAGWVQVGGVVILALLCEACRRTPVVAVPGAVFGGQR